MEELNRSKKKKHGLLISMMQREQPQPQKQKQQNITNYRKPN